MDKIFTNKVLDKQDPQFKENESFRINHSSYIMQDVRKSYSVKCNFGKVLSMYYDDYDRTYFYRLSFQVAGQKMAIIELSEKDLLTIVQKPESHPKTLIFK